MQTPNYQQKQRILFPLTYNYAPTTWFVMFACNTLLVCVLMHTGFPWRYHLKATPFSSTGIGRHNHTLLPVLNILLDPLENGRLGIKVVHRDVEKTLRHKSGKCYYTPQTREKMDDINITEKASLSLSLETNYMLNSDNTKNSAWLKPYQMCCWMNSVMVLLLRCQVNHPSQEAHHVCPHLVSSVLQVFMWDNSIVLYHYMYKPHVYEPYNYVYKLYGHE